MDKEEIIRHLCEGKYELLDDRGIEWWKSNEIICAVLMNGFDSEFEKYQFLEKIPNGVVKDKKVARMLVDITSDGEAPLRLMSEDLLEDLLNDRHVLVKLIIESVSYSTHLPEELAKKCEGDYRIEKLVELVSDRTITEHNLGCYFNMYVECAAKGNSKEELVRIKESMEVLSKKIEVLDEAIRKLSNEIIDNPIEEMHKKETLAEPQSRTSMQRKHIEEEVERFEEIFLSEEAVQKALQRENRREGELRRQYGKNLQMWQKRDPVMLFQYRDVVMKEEHQIGTAMPHGNNLFGLNCHVKLNENGEIIYTLTLNQGAFPPTKTYWYASKVDKRGHIMCRDMLDRYECAAVAYVPYQTEVDPEKQQPCVEMTREEVIRNVREFFNMTNEEVLRRYNIRGPHKAMLVEMIMLDAIYNHDQETDECGKVTNIVIESDTIRYVGKNGELYEFERGFNEKSVILTIRSGGKIEVNFNIDEERRHQCSLDDIKIESIEINGDSEILTLIKERLESVFGGKKHEHTLEEVAEGITGVPKEDIMQVLSDINDDVEKDAKKPDIG